MSSSKVINNGSVLPGAQTLNDIPKRAFAFLNALGTQLNIRAIMKAHGYTQEDRKTTSKGGSF